MRGIIVVHIYSFTNNNDTLLSLTLKSMKCKGVVVMRLTSKQPLCRKNNRRNSIEQMYFARKFLFRGNGITFISCSGRNFFVLAPSNTCIFPVHASSHYLSFLFRPGQGCQKYHSWSGIRANAAGSFTPPILQKNPSFGGGSFEQEGERWE